MSEQSESPDQQGIDEPLTQWIGLEIRRARHSFHAQRKANDADVVARVGRETGVRCTTMIAIADDVATALVSATLNRVAEYQSSPDAIEWVRVQVSAFVTEMVQAAEIMAYGIKAGPAARESIKARRDALLVDLDNAFRLASRPGTSPRPAPVPLIAQAKVPGVGRGRRRGGGFVKKDGVIVERLRAKVVADDISPYAASLFFVDEAAGNGTTDAKAKRLVKRYYERYSETNG